VTSDADADAGANIPAAPVITAIAVYGGWLYYAMKVSTPDAGFIADYGIHRVPTAGGSPELIGLTQPNGIPSALVVDGTYAYYTMAFQSKIEFMNLTAIGDAGIGYTGRGGSDTERHAFWIGQGQGSLLVDTLVVVGANVFWANGATLQVGRIGGLLSFMSVTGTVSSANITGFAIGATSAYFGEDGYVGKAALMGPEAGVPVGAIRIARGQPSPNSFVLDDTSVYWATGAVAPDGGAGVANACAIAKLAQ
jgi:hypothetical protein